MPKTESENERDCLFKHLMHVIVESRKKFDKRKVKNEVKIKWARVLCQAIHEYGILLKLKENDDLLERIERIEKELL